MLTINWESSVVTVAKKLHLNTPQKLQRLYWSIAHKLLFPVCSASRWCVIFRHQLQVLMGIRLWGSSCCSLLEGRGSSSTVNPSHCLTNPTCPGSDSLQRVSLSRQIYTFKKSPGNMSPTLLAEAASPSHLDILRWQSDLRFLVFQEPRATWIQRGWSGCWTAPWATRGHQCVTPERRAKVNRITTGWSEYTRTLSSSGESWFCRHVGFYVVSSLKDLGHVDWINSNFGLCNVFWK